jgi:streptogramin lyase
MTTRLIGRNRPCHRTRTRTRFRLEGLEDRCLLSGISGFTVFPDHNASSYPWGITTGPDGNLWFADNGASKIGVINPTTHAISEFATPTASSMPRKITAGPDGNLWFTEYSASKIGMISPTTHVITEFGLPTTGKHGTSPVPFGITAGPDGNLWFTENGTSKIGMINPTTDAITEFTLPTGSQGPVGITAGPDGNLWFTGSQAGTIQAGQIGMINPATHVITVFPVPTAHSSPGEITAGPDGNLWFTDGAGYIGMINPTTHAIAEFASPTGNLPRAITAGPDGNIWFTEPFIANGSVGREIARINPATDAITEYPTVYTSYGITTGPDGNLWFAENIPFATAGVGVATLASTELVVTVQPPASVAAGSPFGLTVQAEDSSGKLVSSFNGTVTMALASNPGNSTLGGTLSVQASGGVATFSGLTLNNTGSGYVLYVSGGGLGWGVTNPFNVVSSTTSSALAAPTPPPRPSPLLAPLVLDSPDLWDGLTFKKRTHAT